METLTGIITPTNVLTASSTATLTNKTINASNNTVTNVSLSTGVTGTLPVANGGTGTTSTTFANLTTNVTGTLPVANGGTGAATLTANNVLLGNGTSALQVVAPGTSGNVLTSNGTTWASTAPAGGGSLILLQTITASNSSTVDLETSIGSTYDNYLITFTGVAPDTDDVDLRARLKINGTYQTSSYVSNTFYSASDTATISNERPTLYFSVTRGRVGNSTGRTAQGQFWFGSPTSTSIFKEVNFTSTSCTPTLTASYNTGGGLYNADGQALSGVRFYFSTGNIASGVFRLYGIKNS